VLASLFASPKTLPILARSRLSFTFGYAPLPQLFVSPISNVSFPLSLVGDRWISPLHPHLNQKAPLNALDGGRELFHSRSLTFPRPLIQTDTFPSGLPPFSDAVWSSTGPFCYEVRFFFTRPIPRTPFCKLSLGYSSPFFFSLFFYSPVSGTAFLEESPRPGSIIRPFPPSLTLPPLIRRYVLSRLIKRALHLRSPYAGPPFFPPINLLTFRSAVGVPTSSFI